MVRPAVWSDTEKAAWGYDSEGVQSKIGCGVLNLPQNTEYGNAQGNQLDCVYNWFSGGTKIPGERTLKDDQMQPDADCSQEGTENVYQNNPWNAPGTAPTFSPCGANGGYPYGCSGQIGDSNTDDEFEVEEKFGDICPCEGPAQAFGCGGFAYGGLAHQYDWPNAPVTTWKAGSIEDVGLWFPFANHGGGYSYRLCKTPEEGISGLTEECFQNGYLEFSGDTQWMYFGTSYIESESKVEVNATRINIGTYPPGSMWTAVPFDYKHGDEPKRTEVNDLSSSITTELNQSNGHVVDKIKIPSSLEPGEYVLSFRHDTKCTSQVFSSCANIQITN